MPLPLIPLIAGAILGTSTKKDQKKIAVSGRLKKDGTRSKAHLRKKKK